MSKISYYNINGSIQFPLPAYNPREILTGLSNQGLWDWNNDDPPTSSTYQFSREFKQNMQATRSPRILNSGHSLGGDYQVPGAFPTETSEPRFSGESSISNRTWITTEEQQFFDALVSQTPSGNQHMNGMSSQAQAPQGRVPTSRNPRMRHTSSTFATFNDPLGAISGDTERIEYRKYAIPRELLQREDTTSEEIRNLIAASITRLEEQQYDEIVNAPPENQPDGNLDSRSNRNSETSVLSNDSGYLSMPSEDLLPGPVIIKYKTKRGFGRLAAMFKQKGKKVAMPDVSTTTAKVVPPRKPTTGPYVVTAEDNLYAPAMSTLDQLLMASGPQISNQPRTSLDELLASEAHNWNRNHASTPDPALLETAVAPVTPVLQTQTEPIPEQEPDRTPPTPEPTIVECVSCLEDFETTDVRKLECHSYCGPCFEALINTALGSETQWPPKCCLNPIPPGKILQYIPREMEKTYKEKSEEWGTPAGERVYCSRSACGDFIPGKCINKASNTAKCRRCKTKTCAICRGRSHNGIDCPEDPSLRATETLAESEGWRRCYSCKSYVAHNAGCRHMTCRCKAQFCYVCGLKWRTCACTESDLTARQARVTAQRTVQQAVITLEQAAARAREEENRQILEEVEAFERAEQERLWRQAERQRERAAARAAAQRRRLEEARLASVHTLFSNYRVELASLHDFQRILIAERQEFEQETIKRDLENTLDTLFLRHTTASQLLAVESQSRISDAQYRFDDEYQQRSTVERRAEAQYLANLEQFHKGNPNSRTLILAAHLELQNDQIREYKKWEGLRRRQLQEIADAESRKMQILMAQQTAEKRLARDKSAHEMVEWEKKCVADARWVEDAVAVRDMMLSEREQEEYVRDVWS